MLPTTQSACFLIADISGYTKFLSGVELEHAHDIIADVMQIVVKRLRPTFRLAKFEGDAVFLYALADKVDGAVLQDAVDSAYFAFRSRLRSIKQASSCSCSACSEMQKLDLKFVAHHGTFIKHRIAGREELAGRDVILIHRMLKNAVSERLGGRAYALYSEDCIRAIGVDPVAQGLIEHREAFDGIGEVTCWVRDLETAWLAETARARNEVTRDKAAHIARFEFDAPREAVWGFFTRPDLRPKWRAADEVRESAAGGRRGVGTVNHCMHGANAIIEEVLDWRPLDYFTLTTLLPKPDAPKILMSFAFTQGEGEKTQVEIRIARPRPKDQAFVEHAFAHFEKAISGEVEVLRGLLADASPPAAPVEEPDMPVSAGRFATSRS